MTRKDRRKLTVKLVESDAVLNYRLIAEAVARNIKSGGIQL